MLLLWIFQSFYLYVNHNAISWSVYLRPSVAFPSVEYTLGPQWLRIYFNVVFCANLNMWLVMKIIKDNNNYISRTITAKHFRSFIPFTLHNVWCRCYYYLTLQKRKVRTRKFYEFAQNIKASKWAGIQNHAVWLQSLVFPPRCFVFQVVVFIIFIY